MKLIKMDLKSGEVVVLPLDKDDLWHLFNIIEKGDIVKAKTRRRVAIKSGDVIKYGERKSVVLGIEVEKTEFERYTGVLKILGKIIEGPKDIELSYHSIKVSIGEKLTIIKEWRKEQLERIEKSVKKEKPVLVCLIDREQAYFFRIGESGADMLANIKCHVSDEEREKYYKEALAFIKKHAQHENIIIAGPGFERENLFRFIKKMDKDIAKRIVLEHVSYTGYAGINELLKKAKSKIIKDARIARESRIVNKFFEELAKNGLAVYGDKDIKRALALGAIDMLIISQNVIQSYEDIMKDVERQGGRIAIVSDDHDVGKQFGHFGIGALLRFKI